MLRILQGLYVPTYAINEMEYLVVQVLFPILVGVLFVGDRLWLFSNGVPCELIVTSCGGLTPPETCEVSEVHCLLFKLLIPITYIAWLFLLHLLPYRW